VKDKKIGVLMGGLSAEREVSLKTGEGVLAALQARGYDCIGIDWQRGDSLPALLAEAGVEVVWNALHGPFGEDGAVQGLLTCMGIPGTGSGILASALAIDKVASKRLFERDGIKVPPWFLLGGGEVVTSFPCVVKPSNEGSSVGVTIVRDLEDLGPAVALAADYHGPTIIETFIPGQEIHVGILDDAVLGDVEVRPAIEFYDYAAKYERGDTQYIVPAPLAEPTRQRAHDAALAAYRSLGCTGHGRVDLRVTDDGEPYVLEVNTLPGMTATSLLPKIAQHAGMEYGVLCERILASARLG